MMEAVRRGDDQYQIYDAGEDLGWVAVSRNPYHDRHFYLELGLTRYERSLAAELFGLLRRELGRPLQVMLYASQVMDDFLLGGGFECRRRCYELEVSSANLAAPLGDTVPLMEVTKGSAEYDRCRKMLYDYYSETHRGVSPLTVDEETFCADLPDTVLCRTEEGDIAHFAFVEPDGGGCEIAYLGTKRPSDFMPFAWSLMAGLFRRYDFISMECDDTDPAAMALRSLFRLPEGTPYDTYILE